MKVGIITESPADEAAVKILAEAILKHRLEVVASARIRPGGWTSAMNAAPSELYRLHYHMDVEGLIIVMDSDDSPVHEASHSATPLTDCRICQLQASLQRARARLTPRLDRTEVRVAIGLPVPAIEAWYRCGHDPHSAEARFVRELSSGVRLTAIRRQLKKEVYGTDRPALTFETEVATREAHRLAGDLERLRTQFPFGFGSFYETLATWR
jgi:hypothetical protein